MSLINKNFFLPLLSLVFFLGIIVISNNSWVIGGSILFLLLIIYTAKKEYRQLILIFIAFLVSFWIYELLNIYLENYELSRELRVLLNRFLLSIIVLGLCVAHLFNKKKISFFNNKPIMNSNIVMPFHSVKLSHFFLIGLIISTISFVPIIVQQELSYIESILLFTLLFSIINATLEELIWRGLMLSSLKEFVSIRSAVIITSIGFGLLHLTVGIPFIFSLLFSIGGLFYAIVVMKTNSIYPSIIFHFVINVGMVLSGLIL